MYFKNVKSLEDLKSQFRSLALKNHPDAGGDPEVMKEINVEYDALFAIWKSRQEKETGNPVQESAESTRRQFYTAYGWAGSNYNASRSTKDICKIIRTYVKEKYPTYKFSVRFHTASMCSEIYVSLKESPVPVYKTYDELTGRLGTKCDDFSNSDIWNFWRKHFPNVGCYDEKADSEFRKLYESNPSVQVPSEIIQAVKKDVDDFVNSYRMEDCDAMTDYFDVSDYYFGVSLGDCKYVPRTARIQNPKNEMKAENGKRNADGSIQIESSGLTVEKTKHTKTGEDIWVVRCTEKLNRESYMKLADRMKGIGGYYSRYVHGFVFREDPTDKLAA